MRSLAPIACAAVALGLVACGGGDGDSGSAAKSSSGGAGGATQARPRSPKEAKAQKQAAKAFAAARADSRAAGGRAPEGERGAFNAVIAELPIRRPPLPVQQYILDRGHDVIARPEAKDFFCGHSVRDRLVAVEAFYREADKRFRASGITDFELTVAPLSSSLERIRVLAVGKGGKVELTRNGRAAGRC